MKIWDISRTLWNDLAEWPGDEPFHFRLTKKIADGQSVNLGAITMGVHNGTHADAQFHFDAAGESIEKAPLEVYLGRAVVVDLAESFSQRKEKQLITIEDLQAHAEEIGKTSRLLIKTGRWSDSAVRSEEHTSELQSPYDLVCRLLLEKKKTENISILFTEDENETVEPICKAGCETISYVFDVKNNANELVMLAVIHYDLGRI